MVFEGGGERLVATPDLLADVAPVFLEPGHGIAFRLSDDTARAFADLTERLVGEVLSVSVCGVELARPVVQERIAGGRGVVPAADQAQAWALAAALAGDADCPQR